MAYADGLKRRPGVTALAVAAAIFLALSVPRYLTGDPTQSRVPAPFAWHYPLLVAHVVFASIAMLTALLQVWPFIRRRYSRVHRLVGRIYVFGAVLPAGVAGLVVGAATPFGPILAVSNVTLAVLWLGCTGAGYRAGRRRSFAAHRRWMLRSTVLTFSIISNRVWGVVLFLVLTPLRDSVFGGDEQLFGWVLAGMTGWLGWTVPLAMSEYLLRRQPARSDAPSAGGSARYSAAETGRSDGEHDRIQGQDRTRYP